jgi:hypothetical protein
MKRDRNHGDWGRIAPFKRQSDGKKWRIRCGLWRTGTWAARGYHVKFIRLHNRPSRVEHAYSGGAANGTYATN